MGATVLGFVMGNTRSEKEWHVAATAGLSIVISGEWEIEAGNGDRRMLGLGSVLLMLDTHGQGHRSRTYSETGATVLGVGIDEVTRAAFTAIVEG